MARAVKATKAVKAVKAAPVKVAATKPRTVKMVPATRARREPRERQYAAQLVVSVPAGTADAVRALSASSHLSQAEVVRRMIDAGRTSVEESLRPPRSVRSRKLAKTG